MTATTPTRCPTCDGSGIDPQKAATPLAFPHLQAYVAAMNPCLECNGAGTAPIAATMRPAGVGVRQVTP